MVLPLKTAKDIGFKSINALLSKYPPSLLASAIEQHGVYTWDGFNRYCEAKNDDGKGWVCRYDDTTLTYKLRHRGSEETPDRRTRSRALALLELFNTYWKQAEKSGLPLGIENTVIITISKDQMYMYPQNFLKIRDNTDTDTSEISVPLKLRAEINKFGWSSADLPDFEDIEQGTVTQARNTTGKTEQKEAPPEIKYPDGHRESDPLSVFREMDNLKGEDLKIEFSPNQMLVVSINDVTKRVAYNDLELTDKRTGRLNKQGALLLGVAQSKLIPKNEEKTVSKIRGILRGVLNIAHDPFHPRKHNYTPRFQVVDGRKKDDERAYENALRTKSNGGPIIDAGDPDRGKDDDTANWLKENSRKMK